MPDFQLAHLRWPVPLGRGDGRLSRRIDHGGAGICVFLDPHRCQPNPEPWEPVRADERGVDGRRNRACEEPHAVSPADRSFNMGECADIGDAVHPRPVLLVMAVSRGLGPDLVDVVDRVRRTVLLHQGHVDRRCELSVTHGLFAFAHGSGRRLVDDQDVSRDLHLDRRWHHYRRDARHHGSGEDEGTVLAVWICGRIRKRKPTNTGGPSLSYSYSTKAMLYTSGRSMVPARFFSTCEASK